MGYKPSLLLGILGLIPFVLIVFFCFLSPPDQEVYDLLIFIYVSYAVVISSFLGGIQWGLITASSDKIYFIFSPLFISTIPTLVSWIALLFFASSMYLSLILIIISFMIASAFDYYLYQSKIAPFWFLNVRLPLSVCVFVLTITMFFFIA